MMFDENPLEGVGREMIPDETLPEETAPASASAAELPTALTPEEVAAKVEPPTPSEPFAASDGEDKGLGAVEPILDAEELGAPAAPQTEVSVPPPEAMRGAPLFTAASLEAPGPTGPSSPPPFGKPLPPSEEMIRELVPPQSLHQLWQRAETLHEQVKAEVTSLPLARQLLDELQAARNYLMAGPEYYEEAERLLNEVDYRVAMARRVRQWSYTIGLKLFYYEVIWAVLLGLAMLAVPSVVKSLGEYFVYPLGTDQDLSWLVVALRSLVWGGLGGVTGALYALWRHIARDQDFDKQYTMWYLTNPIMGLALGAFVYLVMQAGLLSLTAGEAQSITSAAMVFVMAWIAGFQQNVAYDIVRRILRVFRIAESETSSTP